MSLSEIIITFLVIVMIYFALITIFSLLFRVTGLSKSKAFFQTVSLLTTAGFTTNESELITGNPIRRRLALSCMIIGHFLSITVISLLVDVIAKFNAQEITESYIVILSALGVFVFLLIFFKLPFVAKPLEGYIEKIGYDLYAKKNGGNIITILDNYGDECVAEIHVKIIPSLLENKTLFETQIKDRFSLNILHIKRKNRTINITKDTMLQKDDDIIIYGNKKNIHALFSIKNQNEDEKLDLIKDNSLIILDNFDDKAMVEINLKRVPKLLSETTIFESPIKPEFGINIILVKRDNKIVDIDSKTKVIENDTLIVYGPYKNIKFIFSSMVEE